MRVLYTCPLAHLTGHPPAEAAKETRILQDQGVEVELLTFCGVHEGFEVVVPETKVMSDNSLFKKLRSKFVLQWFLRTFEYASTITKAATLAKDRPIYLRDAEPFPHIVHIVNFFFRKRWVISSTGGLYTTGSGVKGVYKILLGLTGVNLPFWYKLTSNKISYVVQNPDIKTLMQRILGDNITVIPLGRRSEMPIEYANARQQLHISPNEKVLLMLGANHSGKDNETVYKALPYLNVVLIHAGPTAQSINAHPSILVKKYGVENKVILLDRQIGTEEKKLLFGAADWVLLSYHNIFSSTTSMLWEACAYGKPVIASSGSDLEKLVKKWGLGVVFEAGNSASLVSTTHKAMTGLDGWAKENCKEFIDAHSEIKWYEKTISLLR